MPHRVTHIHRDVSAVCRHDAYPCKAASRARAAGSAALHAQLRTQQYNHLRLGKAPAMALAGV